MINAEEHGWVVLKQYVGQRESVCIAIRTDVFGQDIARDVCRDGFRNDMMADERWKLEFDHVTQVHGVTDGRQDDEAHGVAVCPWHHRLSNGWRSDSKEHREQIRAYLTRMYPECAHAAA